MSDGDDEVDRVASMIAGPAAPPFMSVAITEHRHRGVVVLMVSDRAMPLATEPGAATHGWGDLVEERGQVGAVEYVVDPPVRALFSVDHRR
ncbi:MAG: hypothetical protein Q7V57_18440 [Actinomycetota bacterium]|nr:hypothetical protein [Actinomycetota bacterium]